MRLLLDENLDWRLQRDLLAHQVESVPLIGWAGIENGELLRKAVGAGFDALITMDSSMVSKESRNTPASRFSPPANALRSTTRSRGGLISLSASRHEGRRVEKNLLFK
jgi:hypothetical protein